MTSALFTLGRYVRPAEPKMTPMQLAQLQMTLPLG